MHSLHRLTIAVGPWGSGRILVDLPPWFIVCHWIHCCRTDPHPYLNWLSCWCHCPPPPLFLWLCSSPLVILLPPCTIFWSSISFPRPPPLTSPGAGLFQISTLDAGALPQAQEISAISLGLLERTASRLTG